MIGSWKDSIMSTLDGSMGTSGSTVTKVLQGCEGPCGIPDVMATSNGIRSVEVELEQSISQSWKLLEDLRITAIKIIRDFFSLYAGASTARVEKLGTMDMGQQ